MTEYQIRSINVKIADGLGIDDDLSRLVKKFADQRLSRPIVAYTSAGDNRHFLRFATAQELKRLPNTACKTVSLSDCTGRIYTLGGLKPSQLTDADIQFARDLWYEPIIVEKGQDGLPWIDD